MVRKSGVPFGLPRPRSWAASCSPLPPLASLAVLPSVTPSRPSSRLLADEAWVERVLAAAAAAPAGPGSLPAGDLALQPRRGHQDGVRPSHEAVRGHPEGPGAPRGAGGAGSGSVPRRPRGQSRPAVVHPYSWGGFRRRRRRHAGFGAAQETGREPIPHPSPRRGQGGRGGPGNPHADDARRRPSRRCPYGFGAAAGGGREGDCSHPWTAALWGRLIFGSQNGGAVPAGGAVAGHVCQLGVHAAAPALRAGGQIGRGAPTRRRQLSGRQSGADPVRPFGTRARDGERARGERRLLLQVSRLRLRDGRTPPVPLPPDGAPAAGRPVLFAALSPVRPLGRPGGGHEGPRRPALARRQRQVAPRPGHGGHGGHGGGERPPGASLPHLPEVVSRATGAAGSLPGSSPRQPLPLRALRAPDAHGQQACGARARAHRRAALHLPPLPLQRQAA
ncbi:uncharacterized protein LOC144213889 isoform X4 [Stigmatopora nigra]